MNTQTGKPTVHASIITAESSTVKEIQCEPCQAFPFPIEKPTTLESLEALETQMLSMIYQLRELIEIEKSNN